MTAIFTNSSHCVVARWLLLLVVLPVLLPAVGCGGALSQALYLFHGNKVEPAFADFENKRVAVVCDGEEAIANSDVSILLAGKVSQLLRSNEDLKRVKGLTFVRQSQVVDCINNGNWSYVDCREVGKTVDADLVIALDVSGVSVTDGRSPGLYQGHANVSVRVIDVASGEEKLRHTFPKFTYPKFGHKDLDVSEYEFKDIFLNEVAGEIARLFYEHEITAGVATDTVRP